MEGVMSSTGLDVFDTTLQETNLWLKAVMTHLETKNRHQAYIALKSVLHALRDRIGPTNAAHLGAQLPILLRGVYYEGWHMAGTPTKERHELQFLEHVRYGFSRGMEFDARSAARAVFEVMREKIAPGEVAKIINMLPEELRDLWPAVALAGPAPSVGGWPKLD
jgi:uncharacterized protein (DUF2267 family)